MWVEDPGYPGADIVFRAVGAKVCPVPVNAEGLDMEWGRRRWARAKLIYVTPAHQFPLGVTMSLRRRLALAGVGPAFAHVDFRGRLRQRISLPRTPHSRSARPGSRGRSHLRRHLQRSLVSRAAPRAIWLFRPAWWIGLQRRSRSACVMLLCSIRPRSVTSSPRDISRGTFDACASFIPNGLLCSWNRPAPGWAAGCWKSPTSKPDCRPWAGWRQGIRAERAAEEAAKHEVEVIPLSRYSSRLRSGRPGLLLGFAAVDTRELRRGVEQLARALEICRRERGTD